MGAFSEVWHVIDKKYKKEFAMKRLLKSKIIDKKFIKGIIKERNLLSKLNHRFLVNMHFSFQDNHYLYMILDLMKGGDLRYYYKLYNSENKNKKFTENECLFMISNLVLALEYLYKNSIIHCDIKPENIVIDKDGYFYLTDFGISINLKEEEKIKKNNHNNINNSINNNSNNNYIAGSLGYMAPEIMFQEKISFCSDYFSLGVICYEMMIGKLPYLGKGLEDTKKLVMANQVKIKKFGIPKDWSLDAADFINKLIQRKPNKRLGYNNFDEIKNHPWLNNIDWKKLYLHELKSPFVPELNREIFISYFNDKKKEYEDSKISLERYKNIELSKDYNSNFDEFYYFNKYSMRYTKESDIFINPHIKYEDKDNKSTDLNNKNSRNRNNNKNVHRYCLTSNI